MTQNDSLFAENLSHRQPEAPHRPLGPAHPNPCQYIIVIPAQYTTVIPAPEPESRGRGHFGKGIW